MTCTDAPAKASAVAVAKACEAVVAVSVTEAPPQTCATAVATAAEAAVTALAMS